MIVGHQNQRPKINTVKITRPFNLNSFQVSDFGDKVEDSSFLNALQNQVTKWIREIQKVTKLDRDPSSGTALQVSLQTKEDCFQIDYYSTGIKILLVFIWKSGILITVEMK